jgi:FixJ family two-component response regulator
LSHVPVVSIIDDDSSVRAATEGLLRSLGLAVISFASAEDFLNSPRLGETTCLISDVQLPGMSGIDLQDHLIAQGGPVIPVIFITAFPEDRIRKRAEDAGAFGFLSKPFDGQSLIDCLNRALGRPGHGGAP